ncbi:carotenoid biosynthesis protein [Thermococcus sp. CX2]|nr:carotenoid biosynthesis protein [Thermococcus sp. CX2]
MERDIQIALVLILLANVLKTSPIYLVLYMASFVLLSRRAWTSLPRLLLWAFFIGFVVEIIGTRVCAPFGCYEYINLRPQILRVGLFVPFAWAIFGAVSYLAASYYFTSPSKRILFASLLMVIIDLSVDPIMTSWEAWIWKTTTEVTWFDIPWTNYLGWFVVSLMFFSLYELLRGSDVDRKLSRVGPPVYLLEMFTFALYAPSAVKFPAELALVLSIAVLAFPYLVTQLRTR